MQGQKERYAGSAATAAREQFFKSAPANFAQLRTHLSYISRSSDEAIRGKLLLEFSGKVRPATIVSQVPALHSFWLLAFALEGMSKQLSQRASTVTSSALRTMAGALDLLETLCAPDVQPNLASAPPIRLLAVDDNAVCLRSISIALKKVFHEPDLASGGQAALSLVAQNAYDVIFLDVDMPGMDGFELCTKIRETPLNQTTPAVFVTRHSDFDSRAKSAVVGGQDLIGKPYLPAEITVKALTLILRGRLQKTVSTTEPVKSEMGKTSAVCEALESSVPSALPDSAALPADAQGAQRTKEGKRPENKSNPSRNSYLNEFSPVSAELSYSAATENSVADSARHDSSISFKARSQKSCDDPFSVWAPVYLETLWDQLQAAKYCAEMADLQKFLASLRLGVRSFCAEAECVELRTIHRLGCILEGMLKKLQENPKNCTPSALNAAGAALKLLAELSERGGNGPDLASPPPRILVVDDDPVARRTMSGSIQLVFGKPDQADSGNEALTMAMEQPFDLIFLDVVMPGVDGFTACAKIRETVLNRHTPIVFVTSQDNAASLERALAAGGSCLIPKPVLSSQITLTTLTFVMRARLSAAAINAPALEVLLPAAT